MFLRAPGLEHMVLTGARPRRLEAASLALAACSHAASRTGCADRAVRLWDSGTLRCMRTLRGHKAEVTALAVSPDGSELGVSGDRGGTVLLWHASGDAPARAGPLLDSPVVCLAFSPVNARVAAAGCANGAVALLDVAAGALLRRLAAHTGDVQALAFARLPAGGAVLASGGRDRAVHLWLVDGEGGTAALHSTHHVPKAAAGMSEAQRDRLWVALAWLPPRASDGAMQLAGSGYGGDMFVWDLPMPALTASPPHKLGAPDLVWWLVRELTPSFRALRSASAGAHAQRLLSRGWHRWRPPLRAQHVHGPRRGALHPAAAAIGGPLTSLAGALGCRRLDAPVDASRAGRLCVRAGDQPIVAAARGRHVSARGVCV